MMSDDEKLMMDEDEADIINKRFMEPEATLDVVETEMNLDLLAKNIKMEADDDSYENEDIKYEIPNDFMVKPDLISDEEVQDILKLEDSLIQLHMDIRQPLVTLKYLLQRRFGKSFKDFGFTLQGTLTLEEEKNLVDQCVQGEGMVQVHIELKIEANKRNINIVDVLKPAEEYVEIGRPHETEEEDEDDISSNSDMVRWVVDMSFKKDLDKLKIPEDPSEWSSAHVRHWLLWAVRQFNLTGIKLSDWEMTGAQLSQMPHSVFKAKVPEDTDNSFWTHLELLRKCKIVAIRPKESDIKEEITEEEEVLIDQENEKTDHEVGEIGKSEMVGGKMRLKRRVVRVSKSNFGTPNKVEYRNTFSGQIQLWQFLLELLTDKEHRNAIKWLENEGEFKLVDPELVAQLWGARKNKPSMNYEKLSRALRYYYDGDMISKVQGKRFVYKFVCDLKQMVGYSASELDALVTEAALKSKPHPVEHQSLLPIFSNDFITLLP